MLLIKQKNGLNLFPQCFLILDGNQCVPHCFLMTHGNHCSLLMGITVVLLQYKMCLRRFVFRKARPYQDRTIKQTNE
jgi:hypothetical protein